MHVQKQNLSVPDTNGSCNVVIKNTTTLRMKSKNMKVTKPGYHWWQSAQSLEPVAAHPDLEAKGWAHSQADPRHFRVGFAARIFLGDTSASTSCACPRTPSG